MHRLRPLRAVVCCSRARPPQSLLHVSPWPRKLQCGTRACNPQQLIRSLWTSTPLHRQHRISDVQEEEAEDDEDAHEPQPSHPSSSSESTTLRLKYLLRSDFFSSLLLTAYPNLTPLQYRTHLSPFIRSHRTNHHLHHIVQRLIDSDERHFSGGKRRKHSQRNRRNKLAHEVATIYARYVRNETGDESVADKHQVSGGRRKEAAAAEEAMELEGEEDGMEEEEDGQWDESSMWGTDESAVRSGERQQRQRWEQQVPTDSSSFLRGRGGRLRYDPSLSFLADLSQPHHTYPLARSLNRKIILHTGPTNSGKTHAAMEALQSASTGIYAAPLRLLAWEQYDRMTKRGVQAELLTGQEVLTSDDATHISATIEMVSLEEVYDVAVIDEVQMISSEDRGGAWTRALLGIAARVVHVCGDLSVVGLMEDLCSVTGEELQVVRYERLTALELAPPLLSLFNLRRGDCIIAFARSDLYAIKRSIETHTRLRCALIYGSLPPTLRRQQAEQFNAADGPYDIMVATDAVGMGLNLRVGRIVFSTLTKFDGREERLLTVRETLQIAGRAGRFAGAFDVGYVTTLTKNNHAQLRRLMNSPLDALTHAGLGISLAQLESLAQHRPTESLHMLLRYLEQFAALDDLYFLADLSQWIAVARLLHSFPSLSLHERYIFCLAPVSADKPQERATLLSFVHQYTSLPRSLSSSASTVSWRPLANWRRLAEFGSTASELLQLEEAWKALDIYVWLSRRLGEERFTERHEAEEMRELVSEKIAVSLAAMNPTELRKRRRRRERKGRLMNSERSDGSTKRRLLMREASVDWTDVDEGGEEGEVREARVDVVEVEAASKLPASS